MKTFLKYGLTAALLVLSSAVALAQTDRKEVRAGNRQFKKGNWQKAEIEYRKAQVKDSLSFAANYNLAGALYKENNFDEAGKSLEKLKDVAPASEHAADYFYNLGNIAVQKKDWKAAVDAYKRSLLQNPDDLDAKENYAYAKQMLKNEEQQGGGGGNDQQNNQDQQQNQNNNDQDKNKDQNQNQDQDQKQNNDQNKDQNQGDQPKPQQGDGQGEAKISPQQAQQMLKAVQAREKETQDKVNKEKAALLKSRQKEKNW